MNFSPEARLASFVAGLAGCTLAAVSFARAFQVAENIKTASANPEVFVGAGIVGLISMGLLAVAGTRGPADGQ